VILCTGGTSVHVVSSTCHTCFVVGMRYYVLALCSCGIMTCVLVVFYSVYYIYYVLLYAMCKYMYFVVLYIGYRCIYHIVHRV